MGPYPLGTQVTLFFTFLVNSVPTDPTTVTFRVERPDDTIDTFVYGVDGALLKISTGRYELSYLPPIAGTYNYDAVGTGAVIASSPTFSFDVLPSGIGTASVAQGPCEPWIDEQDVALCCSVAVGTDTSVFLAAASQASQLLYELSGRLYTGTCSKTVRPCRTDACGCNWQVLSRGHIVGWEGSNWSCGGTPCGCRGLSRVKLPGYPVRAITQVKIDGAVVPSNTYRLDEGRYLTRVRDPATPGTVLLWPSCQALDLPDTSTGTFSVTYSYGLPPPLLGVQAAGELACELYKACSGNVDDCVLPEGVTRIVRQGITIEKLAFTNWGFIDGTWRTGMPLVDAFLGTYNPTRLPRRPTVWSASGPRYARPKGV